MTKPAVGRLVVRQRERVEVSRDKEAQSYVQLLSCVISTARKRFDSGREDSKASLGRVMERKQRRMT